MGKGDIKTKKGKRTAGSYGVSRPRPSSLIKAKIKIAIEEKASGTKKVAAKKAAPKAKAEKVETTEATAAPAKKKAAKKTEE